MIELTVKDIARVTGGQLFSEKKDAVIKGFSIDSRTIVPGQFFIAVKGKNFDGHDFAGDAVDKGASGLVVEYPLKALPMEKVDHVIVVEDAREAMGMIAAEIRSRVNIPVICVTGTNGKTTLKGILSRILSSGYRVLESRKSYNNVIGLSLTLFDLDPSHDMAVLELGTNHPGEIAKLARIARPTAAIITNIGDGHLEYFVDREGVFKEKIHLLEFLPPSGVAFLNKDDVFLSGGDRQGVVKKFYGLSDGCDFRISDVVKRGNGYSFSLNGKEYFIPLEGEHNVHNAAVAIAAAEHLGVNRENIQKKLEEVSLPEMRLESIDVNGMMFINDSYNANPDSFECALRTLQAAAGRYKGVVAGEMLELGERTGEMHRMIGKSIADKGVDFLITLGSSAGHMIKGALESGMEKERVLCAKSHEEAAEMVRRMARPGTVVLLKGSRASKMEEVLKCFTIFCIR